MPGKVIPIKLPEGLVREIDRLVKEKRFHNRSELIRYATRIAVLLERGMIPLGLKAERYAYEEIKRKFNHILYNNYRNGNCWEKGNRNRIFR